MKKYILAIAAVVATAFASSADTSLAQAYKGLAGLDGMTESVQKSVPVGDDACLTDFKTSTVLVEPCQVEKYRDSFVWMTENLPVRNMVIGANNQNELAMVYATPAAGGKYDVLVLLGNALYGEFKACYGKTDKAGVDAMRNASLSMDANSITLVTTPADGQETFISMSE